MQVAVCPATLTLTTQLGGVSVEDVSRGAGNYPSVLEILDQQPGERFVDVRVVLFMDSRFPDYPGTFLDLRGVVKAPSVTLRMRIVEELKHYLLAGPLAEGLKLFEAENTAAGSLRSVDSLHTPLETIAEEEEEEEEESLFASIVSSLKESALAVGKGLLPGCELRMPHVDFVLHSIRVSVPTASPVHRSGFLRDGPSDPPEHAERRPHLAEHPVRRREQHEGHHALRHGRGNQRPRAAGRH